MSGKHEEWLNKPVYTVSLICNEKIWNELVKKLLQKFSRVGRTFLFIYVAANFFACKDIAPPVYLLCAECFCRISSCWVTLSLNDWQPLFLLRIGRLSLLSIRRAVLTPLTSEMKTWHSVIADFIENAMSRRMEMYLGSHVKQIRMYPR